MSLEIIVLIFLDFRLLNSLFFNIEKILFNISYLKLRIGVNSFKKSLILILLKLLMSSIYSISISYLGFKFLFFTISFINEFKSETTILLDPVYTGKMLFGILDLIKNDKFEEGSKVLAIHTGGIQGIKGINKILKSEEQELINII